jgi:hypothetical protein
VLCSGENDRMTISELGWDHKKLIKYVKRNQNMKRYLIECQVLILVCTLIYGAILGYYAKGEQIVLDAIKIPILFLFSLYIAIPIFFIVDVLLGNKISLTQITTLLLLGFASTGVVLIAFAPLMFFFILTTLDYYFIATLNVVVCGFAGFFGIVSIFVNFRQFHKNTNWYPSFIIGSFIIVFVGTQLAWALRPFLHLAEQFTRPISGNFYIALARLIGENPILAGILILVFGLIALFVFYGKVYLNQDEGNIPTTNKFKSKPEIKQPGSKPMSPPNVPSPYYPGYYLGPPQRIIAPKDNKT